MTLLSSLVHIVSLFDKLEIPYVVGGSLASSIWGKERATQDADVAVLMTLSQFSELKDLIELPYITTTVEIEAALQDLQPFASGQILNTDTLDKIDIFLLESNEYNLARLSRAITAETLPGVELRFSSPEDVVITKLRWFVLGNQISDRQWTDIVQVLEMQSEDLDQEYLDRWTRFFGIHELFVEAKRQALTL